MPLQEWECLTTFILETGYKQAQKKGRTNKKQRDMGLIWYNHPIINQEGNLGIHLGMPPKTAQVLQSLPDWWCVRSFSGNPNPTPNYCLKPTTSGFHWIAWPIGPQIDPPLVE